MAKGVITEIGRIKLCKAHAGDGTLPKIVKMGFGDGGVDAEGSVIETTGKETELKHELLKKDVDNHSYPIPTTATYILKLLKTDLADQLISEQALFDADGDMVAYKTFLPKGKDGDMEFIFEMQEIF